MDSFELTKIAAAVLCAVLVIVGTKTAIELGAAGHGRGEHAGYTLPAPAKTDGAAQPAAAAAFDVASVTALLPKADPEAGREIFGKCAACHTIEKGGAAPVGPNLWGVAGRNIASTEGFAYSEALQSKDGDWTFESLATFIHDPKSFAPGTKMTFAGVGDAAQLADLLRYLNAQGDSPAPVPQ